jgi:hypothetical protein
MTVNHPTREAPYWRRLRYAAWQESNALRADPTIALRARPLDKRPDRLAWLNRDTRSDGGLDLPDAGQRNGKKAA